MPAKFSPAGYLKGLGWTGEGTGLTDAPHARARPVTVAHKKTLSGVGKDRDTAFPWWEAVFASVAGKVGVEGDKKELHRTKTGILSNKPPPPKPDAYVPLHPNAAASVSLPASTSDNPNLAPLPIVTPAPGDAHFADPYAQRSALNLEAMAQVKIEMARRQLYSTFVRGKVIASSGAGMESNVGASTSKLAAAKGRKRKAGESESEDEDEKAASKARRKEMKAMRKEMRAKRRAAKAAKRGASGAATPATTASAESDGSDEEDAVAVEKPAVEEKVKSKKDKKEGKVKKEKLDSKEERRAAKKAKQHLSPEELIAAEEAAYAEAKRLAKAQRKAEKDLAKAVKKSLDG